MSSKEQQKEKPVKINKWDGTAVKNALDDSIRDVLTKKYNYTEHFGLLDGRLAICTLAVGVSAYALIWDYLYPFPQSKYTLIFCVSTYFILMGILSLYTSYVEQGIFAIAVHKDGTKKHYVWEASSMMKKYDDQYHFVLTLKDINTGNVRSVSLVKSVAHFIDVDGYVVHENVEAEVSKMHNSLLSDKKDK